MPVFLKEHVWSDIEPLLNRETLIVLPLGAALKEHGHHLLLSNDETLSQALAARIQSRDNVVITPTIAFFYYPAFLSYPGSTSVAPDTSMNYLWDICRSLALHGPRRFYVLNTGLSTRVPLTGLQSCMQRDGLLLRWTDIEQADASLPNDLLQQKRGSHADEAETSMMLYLAPDSVDMPRAVRDEGEHPRLSRSFSESGVFGDPTRATREKGRVITQAWLRYIQRDIEKLRLLTLPPRRVSLASEA